VTGQHPKSPTPAGWECSGVVGEFGCARTHV
jgi:hypothetical protein